MQQHVKYMKEMTMLTLYLLTEFTVLVFILFLVLKLEFGAFQV
jgi:hypothetical protein